MTELLEITEQYYDEAVELLWDLIFKLRKADEAMLGEAEEDVSMQLTEVTNLAWMIGKQSMSVGNSKVDSIDKESN